MYLSAINRSIMVARVAGVPNPLSFIASASSSSSTSLPALSIAESRVASVYRAGGLVCSYLHSVSEILDWGGFPSASLSAGRVSGSALRTDFP